MNSHKKLSDQICRPQNCPYQAVIQEIIVRREKLAVVIW